MATKLTQEEVIKRLIENRGTENFDYSKVIYKNRRTPITIICKKHGKDFSVLPDIFCSGKKEGCELCGRESYRSKRVSPIDKVIEEFRNIHGSYYDYSKANYINTDTKIEIICPKHGWFVQKAYVHCRGDFCPKCKRSRGEDLIENYLIENSINIGVLNV